MYVCMCVCVRVCVCECVCVGGWVGVAGLVNIHEILFIYDMVASASRNEDTHISASCNRNVLASIS